MATIYNGKHCVFEQVGVERNIQWNTTTNVDSDDAYNDWNISNMRNTHLPATLLLLSNDLQSVITNTTIQTATNGNNGTLVSTSDKIFLAAEKEMTTSPSLARSEESNALFTWNYWVNHTQQSDRIKYDTTNTARTYRLRSPSSGEINNIIGVHKSGTFGSYEASGTARFSLCYAF